MLEIFHPEVARWFRERVGTPTDIQNLAWPLIAAGEHVLVAAPTGSGKTLTAFLWAIDSLLTGRIPAGGVRVLYVSPLRALGTDVRRNLERPLEELLARFRAAGHEVPEIRALTRSGDTPQDERRKMLRQPPEILITTPESLNVLLTSMSGRRLLSGLAVVILDEIHAVAATKRGTHLITAVERLVPLAGEFQRLALSATVRPLETVAEFVGGFMIEPGGEEPVYRKRHVTAVRSQASKRYDVRVRFPARSSGESAAAPDEEARWGRVVHALKTLIARNRSTLLFANSRRMVEKLTRFLNEGERTDLAYSHHGSLSREVRAVVERRLKEGELKAIVATSSLELGIDVGALDEVVLVQTPRAATSAIQRVGRAGHGVGETSRGTLCPLFGRDLLDAAVVARAIHEQDVEPLRPIEAPLDVLAQVILSMTVGETWALDELFAHLRTAWPYRQLRRRQFELVIDMLAGRYADSRIRELRPRLELDRVKGTARAKPGVERLLYMAGGTIADRGYFALRLEGSMAKIGELDEEFVWERSVGDSFTLGAQGWRIRAITHNDVLVVPSPGASALAPFWRADTEDRGFHLAERLGRFLEWIDGRLGDPELPALLERDHALDPAAAAELLELLERQRSATGVALPHRHHLLAERLLEPIEKSGQRQLILHTFWGGRVNRPFALALAAAWEERHPSLLEVTQEQDCLLVRSSEEVDVDELLELVVPEHVETWLRRRLERTGFFGARFRLAASTALLLPKSGFRTRTPLWLSRQRSKKLLETVARYGDFPILVETWRSCLEDGFDLEPLRRVLGELRRGEIRVSEVTTHSPSPLAAELVWQETNRFMYEDDTPESGRVSNLRQDLLQELVFSAQLRPRLPAELVERFRRKVQRTSEGYAPRPGAELCGWLDERVLVPAGDWRELLTAVMRDGGVSVEEAIASAAGRAAWVMVPGAEPCVVALERLPRLAAAWGLETPELLDLADPHREAGAEIYAAFAQLRAEARRRREEDGEEAPEPTTELAELLAEGLRFYGPLAVSQLAAIWGLDELRLREVLELLEGSQRVVIDQLSRGAEGLEVCDAENLEILLRWLRSDVRPSFEARPAAELPLFLALYQGVARPGGGTGGDLRGALEQLFGWPAPAVAWETEILPARLAPYYPAWLDSLMQESELGWFGCGPERLAFALRSDLELFREPGEVGEEPAVLLGEGSGKLGLGELAARSGRSTAALTETLWRLAWEGEVSNDSFVAVRKGIESKFQPAEPAPARSSRPRHGGRARFDRWQSARPFYGSWYRLPSSVAELDALEREELIKDRVRVLLARYGLLFRELLARELSPLQWGQVFRTLRLMELSGEVVAGHFFEGIRGLQFLSHAAFKTLKKGLAQDVVYWLNATDPASLCGVEVEGLRGELPSRQRATHLVYHGTQRVVVSQRRGKQLEIRVEPGHPHLGDYFEVFKVMLTREFRPMRSIEIETINGEPAFESPYAVRLGEHFHLTREQRSVKLWKRY